MNGPLDWSCAQCGKKYSHPTFVIQHVTKVHFGGFAALSDVAKLVRVYAETEPENE